MPSAKPASLPVAVIGGGPIGLAAAAHLAHRGIPFVLFETGNSVGANLVEYRHVRLFSPWRYNVDKTAVELLRKEGWRMPRETALPTAGELVDQYLAPLSRISALAESMHLGTKVVSVSRATHDKVKSAGREQAPFLVRTETNGSLGEHLARAVIDASGTWSNPNPLGGHGLHALGERDHAAKISYGMPDVLGAGRARYAGKKVLVVGAGHSAAGSLLSLEALAAEEPRTRIAWAVRGRDLRRLFGGGENDGFPARGELGTRLQKLVTRERLEVHLGFRTHSVVQTAQGLSVIADDPSIARIEHVDEIIVATGARPDFGPLRELRLRLDPWLESTDALAPLIDPNVHSCGTVRPHGHRELAHPETGFYAIGAKSYGRAPNFLMATGYEQARSVVAALAGDHASADDVQLALPETGVCSTDFAESGVTSEGAGCCGGPAKTDASACCALDEARKVEREAGCGCSTRKKPPAHA